jgi:PAS domain S-box-containing protein
MKAGVLPKKKEKIPPKDSKKNKRFKEEIKKSEEEALRESEERFRDLVEHSLDLICTHDLKGTLLSVNPAATRLSGFSEEELVGKNLKDFLAPEVRAQFESYLAEIQAKGIASGFLLMQTKGGEKRLWEYHNTLKTKGIEAPIVRGTAHDVTERKKAEEALELERFKLREYFENLPMLAYNISFDGKIADCNNMAVKVLGYKNKDELLGKPLVTTVYAPSSHEKAKQLLEKWKREGKIKNEEMQVVTKHGKIIDVLLNIDTIYDYKGNPLYSISTQVDITERKKVETRQTVSYKIAEAANKSARLEELLEYIHHELGHVIDTSNFYIALYDDSQEILTFPYYIDETLREGLSSHSRKMGNGLTEYVIKNRRAVLLHQDEMEKLSAQGEIEIIGTPSLIWLGTPLMTRDKLIGVLAVQSYTSLDAYTEEDLKFLEFTSHQIASTIERKRAEEDLRESEQRLKEAQALGKIGNWEFDIASQKIKWSDQVYELYERNKALGPPSDEEEALYYSPEETKRLREFARLATEKGEDFRYDLTAKLPSGRIVFFNASMHPVKDEKGHIIKLFGTVQDITERKKAEEALRESESSLQAILRSTADGILAVSRENKVLFANERFAEMWRIPWAVMASKDDSVLLQHVLDQLSDPQSFLEKVQELYKSKEENFDTLYFKDGRVFERLSRPLLHETELRGRVWSFRDITERKKAEEALRFAEQRYHRLFEEAPVMYVLTRNQEGVPMVTDCNMTFLRTLGYASAEVIGRPLTDFYTPASRQALQEGGYQRALAGQFITEERELMTRTGGIVKALLQATTETAVDGRVIGTRAMFVDITDRKRAEEALQESEGKYRALVETTDTGFLILDWQGRVLDANQEYVRLTGHSELREILGRRVTEWTAEHAKQRNAEAVAQCVRDGLIRNLIIEYVDESGRITPVEINATVNGEGESLRIVSLCRDITERKQVEGKLEASEEKYRSLFENVFDGVYQNTPEGRFLTINPALVKMLGYDSEEELMIINVGELYMNPQDREVMKQKLESEREVRNYELILKCKDGQMLTALQNAHVVYDEHGCVSYYEGTLTNITERKVVEEALRESEERYKLLFERNLAGVFQTNIEGKIIDCNDGFAYLLGYSSKEEVLAESAWNIYSSPEDRVRFIEMLKEKGSLINYESHLKRKDGQIIFTLENTNILKNEKDASMLIQGTIIDITKRKRAEEALRESEERFRTTLEKIEDGYYEVDLAGNFTFFNDSMNRMLGYEIEEIMGMNNREYMSVDTAKIVYETFNDVYRTGRPLKAVGWELIRKDGSKLFVETSVTLMKDKGGAPVGFRGICRDITERKKAEKALQESKELYRNLVENISDVIFEIDGKGVITYISPVISGILGYAVDEIIGKSFMNFVNEDDRKSLSERFSELQKGVEKDFEYKLIHKSGNARWVRTSTKAIFEGGSFKGGQGTIIDITERKKIEKALEESEKQFRTIFENSIMGIYRTTPDGRILMANPRLVEMLGYISFEELASRNLEEEGIEPEYSRKEFKMMIEKEGEIKGLESVWTIKDLSTIYVRENVKAIRGEDGVALYYDGVVEDITERKKVDEELRALKNFNEGIVQTMTEGIAIDDEKGYFTFINPEAARILGYAPGELVGKHWTTVVPPDQQPIVYEVNQRRMRGEGSKYELVLVKKNGERVAVLESGNARFEEGRFVGTLVVFTDITGRKRMEEELENNRQNLEEIVRQRTSELEDARIAALNLMQDANIQQHMTEKTLLEKETLLQEVHHRVKNNLQVISSLIDMQRAGIKDLDTRQVLLDSQARIRAMAIIHEKLYQSRELGRINVEAYVRVLIDYLADIYREQAKNIAIEIQVDDLSMDIDTAIPCGLIINEVASNAFKYAFTPEWSGNREVRLEIHEREESTLSLEFSDNGGGIPDTLEIAATSTLGLRLVTMLVRQLRGTLELNRHGGTSFLITFPYAKNKIER